MKIAIFVILNVMILIIQCDRTFDTFGMKVLKEMGLEGKETIDKKTFEIFLDKYIRSITENVSNYSLIPSLYKKLDKLIPGDLVPVSELSKHLNFRKVLEYMGEIYIEDYSIAKTHFYKIFKINN
jgi:hypothetical protein